MTHDNHAQYVETLEYLNLALDYLDDAATVLDATGDGWISDACLAQYDSLMKVRQIVKDLARL